MGSNPEDSLQVEDAISLQHPRLSKQLENENSGMGVASMVLIGCFIYRARTPSGSSTSGTATPAQTPTSKLLRRSSGASDTAQGTARKGSKTTTPAPAPFRLAQGSSECTDASYPALLQGFPDSQQALPAVSITPASWRVQVLLPGP
ncbi:hypothetical protein B566_EDAN016634 [Ephemera danica]|nr:hypothetical protein B566_EDAN016634 [Ephemera danica]